MAKITILKLLLQYPLVLLFSFLITFVIAPYYSKNVALLHTGIELMCVFIALCSYFIIFHAYKQNPKANLVMGLGFLMVGVFDLFHTFYHQAFSWYPQDLYDINTRFWIFGRLTESFLFLTATKTFLKRMNRHLGSFFAFAIAFGLSLIMFHYPQAFPVLLIKGVGVTPIKIFLEYIIIALYIISIYFLYKEIREGNYSANRYLLIALLFAIPAELCFTLYTSITDYTFILGHVFKVCGYYYIFKGIFVSSISYPYEELEKSQRIMSKIFNHFPLAIVTFDHENRLTFANTRAKGLFACDDHHLAGLNTLSLHVKFNMVFWDNHHLYISSKVESKNNICNLTDLEGNIYVIKLETYDLGRYGSMYIFEEARKDQELENLQLQTKTVLNSISNMVIICNSNLEILMCNRALLETFKIEEGDIFGKNLFNFSEQFLEKQSDSMGISEEKLLTGTNNFEVAIINSENEKKILSGSSSPVYNIENQIIGSILVITDVTEKEAMREMMQQQEKLAVLGQMAAGIVHEIKNPLTAIKGFNQMILGKTHEELTREFSEIIGEEVEQVNRVVSDFLAFAKPRKPELREISLSQLIKSIETMIETQLFINRIDFELILPKTENVVEVDDGQLKQVILNIVKNAIDAMNNVNNPKLCIRVDLIDKTGEMRISISDNGKGISPKEIHKLGTPFFTTKEKGTGLGLSICYQIIKENNGKISFESKTWEGTTFNILLPYSRRSVS